MVTVAYGPLAGTGQRGQLPLRTPLNARQTGLVGSDALDDVGRELGGRPRAERLHDRLDAGDVPRGVGVVAEVPPRLVLDDPLVVVPGAGEVA